MKKNNSWIRQNKWKNLFIEKIEWKIGKRNNGKRKF